jgi:methionyl aminopeptidase
MSTRNDPCWCGSGKKFKKCHYPVMQNNDIATKYLKQYGIIIKTPTQIEGIKKACKTATNILNILCEHAKCGVTTNELDRLAQKLHKEAHAIAAPLGYGQPPFPKSICTSLNDVICHGIPNDIPLKEGDIMNIDVTAIVDGYYGDVSKMVAIGNISEEKQRVIKASEECLNNAISICKPGLPIYEIGNVIEEYAKKYNCSVVYQFVGHGVGVDFHEPPQIPHCYNNVTIPLVEGMTFTIEPMINAGIKEGVIDPINQWEARTKDGKPSAQFEHTILITKTGHEILTL